MWRCRERRRSRPLLPLLPRSFLFVAFKFFCFCLLFFVFVYKYNFFLLVVFCISGSVLFKMVSKMKLVRKTEMNNLKNLKNICMNGRNAYGGILSFLTVVSGGVE